MTKILAIPGSLRPNSSSNLILSELSSFLPPNVTIEVYQGVGSLPHFNDAEQVHESVADFRDRVREADAVLICTPEYAFGIPGSLKNALDWTVSSGEFYNKAVGLITASSQGEKGHAAMMLVLTAISAHIIEEASMVISFVRSKLDSTGKIKDEELSNRLKKAVQNLALVAHKEKLID
jgi:chromate reductase, NAD(P)H dehydrogenase (quinone)